MLNPGDVVVCVDASDSSGALTEGNRYTIKSTCDKTVTLEEIDYWWFSRRFKAIPKTDNTEKQSNPKDSVGSNKAGLTAVPLPVLFEVGAGMHEGARKYGRHNYRAIGVRTSVYIDAAFRHIAQFWEGQDIDPDSGINHISKAIASLVVLRDAQMQGNIADDRPPASGEEWISTLNKKVAEINEKYPNAKEVYTEINNDK